MALITYSGDEQSAGINLHRDDSYADFEARTISLETVEGQETQWQMKQAYPGMGWVKEQNAQAELVNFSIPSGSMMAFNCKILMQRFLVLAVGVSIFGRLLPSRKRLMRLIWQLMVLMVVVLT
ncbi:MAG: hypothetical protein HC764_22390 [Pleurocapsa sp. CRU_1_2]|nr:hypothetical protein [Pleurocapsa sp. CRU_1_2]